MFGVYMFGSDLERVWGPRRYLSFLRDLCVVGRSHTNGRREPDASLLPDGGRIRAVFGLLLAYALVFPNRTIISLFAPIPMRAPVFVAAYGALELVFGVTGTQAGVAHFAHLGGLAGGFLLMRFWKAWR